MDFQFRKNVLVLLSLSILGVFSKTDFIVKFQDIDIEYVNYEYIDEDTFDFSVNYINKTYNTLRLKAVVIKDFPPDLKISLKAYSYALGDFRIPMGFDMHVSTCDLKDKHIFMAPFILAIGGDLNKCAPDKGEYGNESFYPVNISALPKLFPKNQYRHDIKVGNNEIDIVKFKLYLDAI